MAARVVNSRLAPFGRSAWLVVYAADGETGARRVKVAQFRGKEPRHLRELRQEIQRRAGGSRDDGVGSN